MTFKTEEEAQKALEATRKPLIDAAEAIGIELLDRGIAKGERPAIHSQMIEPIMVERGFVTVDDPRSRRWMGSVFRRAGWVKLGMISAGNTTRNNHASPRGLWTREGYPIPDGMCRIEYCIVCGRGEKDRPKLSTMKVAFDAMRKLHLHARSSAKELISIGDKAFKKRDEAMIKTMQWLKITIERGE